MELNPTDDKAELWDWLTQQARCAQLLTSSGFTLQQTRNVMLELNRCKAFTTKLDIPPVDFLAQKVQLLFRIRKSFPSFSPQRCF